MKLILLVLTISLSLITFALPTTTVSAAACIFNQPCTMSNGNAGNQACKGSTDTQGLCTVHPANPTCGGCFPTSQVANDVFVVNLPGGRGIDPGDNPDSLLKTIVNNAIIIIFSLAALFVLVMLIIGGLQWILSGGDKDALLSARKRITNALIGLAILALVFLIVTIIGRIVGFSDILSINLPVLNQ